MDKSYEECLRLQENKYHMYTDLKYDKVYTLKIVDITTDNGVKVELEVANSAENLLELKVSLNVKKNKFNTFIIEPTFENDKSKNELHKDILFHKTARPHIFQTLNYILELIKKGITDKYFVGERSAFNPSYSNFSITYVNNRKGK